MRRIPEIAFCLLGLTAVLLFFVACGQNEGGRCQVTSDCASGLVCKEVTTGNGTCLYPGSTGPLPDASLEKDVAGDLPVVTEIEVGLDSAATPEIDAEVVDTGAVESGSLDSGGID
jgi:hypothetical protein